MSDNPIPIRGQQAERVLRRSPLYALCRAEAELAVLIAEMQGSLAGLVAQHQHIRHALAGMENADLPHTAGAEAWQEYCDRVYAELVAMSPFVGAHDSGKDPL